MYYEEKCIDGRLYFRGHPRSEWCEFSPAMYRRRGLELTAQLKQLEST